MLLTYRPSFRRHSIRQTPAPHFFLEAMESRTLFASFAAGTVPELIAAINAANASAGADTITLAANTVFSLTAVDNGGHALGNAGLPRITDSGTLTILGNGGTIERSAAAPAFRLLTVAAGGSLALKDLTLQGGLVFDPGGGIYNQGAVTLDNVIVQNNTARGTKGFYFFGTTPFPGTNAQGGGVYSIGSLSLTGCTIRNNLAVAGERADKGWTTVQGNEGTGSYEIVHVSGTRGGDAFGGGIYVASGSSSIRTSAITANAAQGGKGSGNGKGSGGGIDINTGASVGLDAFTVKHIERNSASSAKDIFGSYTVIV